MRISMQTADASLQSARAELERLTAEYESRNGPVQTTAIIKFNDKPHSWNGSISAATLGKGTSSMSEINKQIELRYANTPCLRKLAKDLGISVNSVMQRAARIGVVRNETVKTSNHPASVRAAQRLKTTAELLSAGKTIDTVAEKLDISPRLVRQYRKQLETMQEAA